MSEQLWYYIDTANAQHGPITIPELQALVANGQVTPATIVWTEALGQQWIPASNVEGLFPESIPVKPDPNTASVAVQAPHDMPDAATMGEEIAQAAEPPAPTLTPAPAPTLAAAPAPATLVTPAATSAPEPAATSNPAPALRAPGAVVQQPLQPQVAPTTPMLASTPTTQPVAGTVASAPGANLGQVTPVAKAGETADAVAVAADAQKKGKNVLGIILLLVGIGLAGYGGYVLSTDGGTGLSYGLLGGGGVVAILGLIMTLKGKKVSEPLVTPAGGSLGALGAVAGGATQAASASVAPAASPASAPAGTFDVSAAADVAPIPAGTAPVAIKANPLMPAAAATTDTAAKPSPFAGVHAATKPNPLLASGTSVAPQNKLNTTVPAKPAEPANPEQS